MPSRPRRINPLRPQTDAPAAFPSTRRFRNSTLPIDEAANAAIPPFFRNVWDDYLKQVNSFLLPEKARFRQIHEGHGTFLRRDERRFVTPEAIRGACLVGKPDPIIEQMRAMERVGIREVFSLPPADTQREVFRDFAERVTPAFR